MKKNKNAFIALAVGAVMLSGAALANFASSNGYNAYKESVRKAFFLDNYSVVGEAKIDLDGEVLINSIVSEQYDKASNSLCSKLDAFDISNEPKYHHYTSEEYTFDGKRVFTDYAYRYPDKNEPKSKYKYVYNDIYPTIYDASPQFSPGSMFGVYDEDGEAAKKRFDKFFNFGASCVDLVLGDIKNNFVLMSTENGVSTYEVNLDLFQIPDIANTGMDLLVSQINDSIEAQKRINEEIGSEYTDNFANSFVKISSNTFINDASCTVSIDENGNLRSNALKASVCGKDENGDLHTINFMLSLEFSDIGTTVPDKIDVDSPEVLKESDRLRTRLTELERLLEAGSFDSEEEKEQYEFEYEDTKSTLEKFDANGGKPLPEEEYYKIHGRPTATAVEIAETEEAEVPEEAEEAEEAE